MGSVRVRSVSSPRRTQPRDCPGSNGSAGAAAVDREASRPTEPSARDGVLETVEPARRGRHPRDLRGRDRPRGVVRELASRFRRRSRPRSASGSSAGGRGTDACRTWVPASPVATRRGRRSRRPGPARGVDGPGERGRFRDLEGRVRRRVRPGRLDPPFLEVTAPELRREPIRAPLGRPLLGVPEQGGLDELLLGQHPIPIGIRCLRTSMPDPRTRQAEGKPVVSGVASDSTSSTDRRRTAISRLSKPAIAGYVSASAPVVPSRPSRPPVSPSRYVGPCSARARASVPAL